MKRILLGSAFLLTSIVIHAQIITTFAGNNICGYSGDNSLATTANLNYPSSVVVDSVNNIYFVERLNNVVRKISGSGIITTVAGNGIAGFIDNVPATSAQLSSPVAIAVDRFGNLFIVDEGNNKIRKVNLTTGIISTLAGNGSPGFGGDGGAATAALLNYPAGITADLSGNVYISDHLNFRVRKINIFGIISTYAGDGTNSFWGDGNMATAAGIKAPNALVCDKSGDLIIVDGSNRIRKVNALTHVISTIAGNGIQGYNSDEIAATAAELFYPLAVTVDKAGNVYIADNDNNRIRQIDEFGVIHTIVGNGIGAYNGDGGLAISANIHGPEGVSFDSCGSMYVADAQNCRIRKITFPRCNYLIVGTAPVLTTYSFYPNPSTNQLNITNIKTPTTYHLLNLLGTTTQQGTLKAGDNTISIKALPPGMYMLELTDEERNRTVTKIIKQ